MLNYLYKITKTVFWFYFWNVLIMELLKGVIMLQEIKIENLIYEIRNKQVMLDSEISATKWHDKEY